MKVEILAGLKNYRETKEPVLKWFSLPVNEEEAIESLGALNVFDIEVKDIRSEPEFYENGWFVDCEILSDYNAEYKKLEARFGEFEDILPELEKSGHNLKFADIHFLGVDSYEELGRKMFERDKEIVLNNYLYSLMNCIDFEKFGQILSERGEYIKTHLGFIEIID